MLALAICCRSSRTVLQALLDVQNAHSHFTHATSTVCMPPLEHQQHQHQGELQATHQQLLPSTTSCSCTPPASLVAALHTKRQRWMLQHDNADHAHIHQSSPFPGFKHHRMASTQPESAVYSGPSPPLPRRVTLRTLRTKYAQGVPISMATAYDYPSAVHVDQANLDILLVGDSVAMVVHGHDTTLPVTMDEMLLHCKAVARGARRAFLVGDLPFGSYETNVRDAVVSATRLLKEGQMDAVKLEGGSPARVEAAHAIVEAGVAVMGHVGLTPQSISVIGGFRPQAQVAEEALMVLDQAQALQRAGCFALVLECVPGPIAAAITQSVGIPTIGIGAGPSTSGQVLVYHDMLGMMSHPHHAKVAPKFCKAYAQVGKGIQAALQQYRDEVTSRQFPSPQHTPYRIPQQEVEVLAAELRKRGSVAAAQALEEAAGCEMEGTQRTEH